MEDRLLSGRLGGAARRFPGKLRRAALRRLHPETASPGEHWLRETLNESVAEHIRSLGPEGLSAAEISGGFHAGHPWREYTTLDFPAFDLCAPPARHRRFDVVICEQVLEHVPQPFAAVETLGELCVPGGHVIVSTPFLVRVHELPMYGLADYWRFTPRGLRALLESTGLTVERIESWGNRRVIAANLDWWSRRRPWQTLRNEPDLPVQVWAFARKPG